LTDVVSGDKHVRSVLKNSAQVFLDDLVNWNRNAWQVMLAHLLREIHIYSGSFQDIVDAFEKLFRLSLKHQQEREIIHVIMDCCLQEKVFNPYYAFLAQKFCEYDRRFQVTFYSIQPIHSSPDSFIFPK
jgi:hypothetical protein